MQRRLPKPNSKRRNARPLGRVVGGVYVINTKKSSERGRPRRRPQRDMRLTSPRGRIPVIDPVARSVGRTVFPSDQWAPGDPRWRSRNLGHLIDTPLGWVADLGGMIPVAGPIVGPVLRGACKGIRAIEDGINWGTSYAGLTFFLIALFSFGLTPAEAIPAVRYKAQVGNYSRLLLTNCCPPESVRYCSMHTCIHDAGCAICVGEDDGNVTCWVPDGIFASHPPGYNGIDPWLTHHIEAVSAALLACDWLELGEVCAGMVWLIDFSMGKLWHSVNIVQNATCWLQRPTGVDPGILSWIGWIKSEVQVVAFFVSWLSKVPVAMLHLVTNMHYITLCSFLYYFVSGNPVKVAVIFLVYVESAAAAPGPAMQRNCSWFATLPEVYLGCSPFVQPCYCSHLNLKENVSDVVCFNPFAVPTTINPRGSYIELPPRPFGCVIKFNNGSAKCCSGRRVPHYCHGCASDCSWRDPRQTYEVCGTTPWVSTSFELDGSFTATMVLGYGNIPTIMGVSDWKSYQVQWPAARNRILHLAYNKTWSRPDVPPGHWSRVPGVPESYRSWWIWVPYGFYADARDISTGYITKDTRYPEYQLVMSATGALSLSSITTKVMVAGLMALLGGKWTLMLYCLSQLIQESYGLPAVVYGTLAASTYDSYVARVVVWLLIYKFRGRIWIFLCANPRMTAFLIFCNYFFEYVAAEQGFIPPIDMTALISCCTVFLFYMIIACQAGLFAQHIPRLTILRGYLSQRWSNFVEHYGYSCKEILLVAVALFPGVTADVVMLLLIMWACTVITLSLLIALITPTSYPAVCRLMNRAAAIGGTVGHYTQKIIIWAAGEKGTYFYQHLGQELPVMESVRKELVTEDPYSVIKTRAEVVEDHARKLACGDTVKGLPVIGRLDGMVLAGSVPLPAGWARTAPFSLERVGDRYEFKSWAVSLVGVDRKSWTGSIFVVGTALRGWMGFTCNGVFHTAHHGSRGRRMSSHRGPLPPIHVDVDNDYATYPSPAGAIDFEECTCSPHTGWLVTRIGTIIPVTKHRDHQLWTCSAPFPVSVAKGTSGAPLLCSAGHVIGMFTSGHTARGAVYRIRVRDVATTAGRSTTPSGDLDAPPTVPKDEQAIRLMVAPTGSGKSTKLPAHYVREGYNVLVLNPSVATTLNFPTYMKENFGISPNIRSGETTITTGSKLTYSTYGRWLASDLSLTTQDVIICDECHATDPTTVLGIGKLLENAPHFKAKLIILATATPPGTPLTPHPNIEEVELDKEGDIPFHGKALKVANLKKGRHLIFQASKNHCDSLAADLVERGIKAVAYYRGLDVACIPTSGDVVVVATDALMTGYTGNFDSVTDCCLSIEPHVAIDMDPTFTLSVRTIASSNTTRMQRRGRTGRGKRGLYRYVSPTATMSGRVPEAIIVEAFDSAISWFGMSAQEALAALDTYRQTPGLPCPVGNLQDWAALFSMLTWVTPASVSRAKKTADNYVLLTAAQMDICKEHRCDPPSEEPRWAGLIRRGQTPEILYHLDGHNTGGGTDPELCEQIRACFADHDHEYSAGGVALGVGFGLAATVIAFDLMGSFTVRACYKVVMGNSTIEAAAPTAYMTDGLELEECVSVPWDVVNGVRERLAAAISPTCAKILDLAQAGVPLDPEVLAHWQSLVAEMMPGILSAVQYGAGLLTLQDNPVLAGCMAYTSGLLCPLGVAQKVFLSLLGGAFAAKLGTTRGAMAFVGAGIVGSLTAATGMSAILASLFTGYASASSVCVVVYKLLCREMPSAAEWFGLITSLLNPGAAIAGAAIAALAFHLTTPGPDHWPNRLLAMLTRGNVLPDEYFLKSKDLRKDLALFFSKCTVWQVCLKISDYLNAPTEADCAGSPPRVLLASAWQSVCRVLRVAYEFCLGIGKRIVSIPGVPVFGCQKPYNGRWYGSGMVVCKCTCGKEGSWLIEHGVARPVGVSRTCRAWWGGVPINNTFVGNARPNPTDWRTAIALTGFNNYLQFEKKDNKIYLTAVSDPTVAITGFIPKVGGCSMVDGARVDPWSGEPKTPWKGAVTFKGKQVPLPICLSDELPKEPPPPKPGTNESMLDHLGKLKPNVLREVADISTRLAEIGQEKKALARKTRDDVVAELAAAASQISDSSSRLYKKMEEKYMCEIDQSSSSTTSSVERDLAALERVLKAKEELAKVELDMPPLEGEEGDELQMEPIPKFTAASSDSSSAASKPKPRRRKRRAPGQVLPTEWVENEGVRQSYRAISGAPWAASITYVEPTSSESSALPPVPESTTEDTTTHTETATTETTDTKTLNPEAPSFEPTASMSWDPAADGSEWETQSSPAESFSRSYVWNGGRVLAARMVQKVTSATAVMTRGLMKFRGLPYVTDPTMVTERIKKVTIDRQPIYGPEYKRKVEEARRVARQLTCEMWGWEEIAKHTPSKSAKSAISGLTAADVRSQSAKAKQEIGKVLDQIKSGRLEEPYNQVTVVPKSEVFVKTPAKPTMKPPRIIAYPHLEVRCAEKAYLGDVAQRVAKAVVGEGYGFQYSPQQRVEYLLKVWRSYNTPMGFTFDTHCFDSTVTPEDMAVEASILTAPKMSEEQKDGIRVLSKFLYESSVMVNVRGEEVGTRFCRASGTYTTSAGNTITCFIKASAAAEMAGLRKPRFLVHGDDLLVVSESDCPAVDSRRVTRFAAAMKALGCIPGAVPVPRYSLELLDTCSSNVSVATTMSAKPFYYLTRDPTIPLARASAEGEGYNPSGAWAGYLVANYPALWCSRILAVHLMDILLNCDIETLEFDWYGNRWALPIRDLPEVIAALHGKLAFQVKTYTPYEVSRVSAALRDLGIAPLRTWKKKARTVRAACIRRGGVLREVASKLLWFAGSSVPRLDDDTIQRYSNFTIFDVYSDPGDIKLPSRADIWRKRVSKALLYMGITFVFFLAIRAFVGV